MRRMLYIESACVGLLTVNGQFCGPLEKEGQAFPMGDDAQAYVEFTAYDPDAGTMAAVLEMRNGRIVRLEPKERCFALVWPDGVVQLELRLREGVVQEAPFSDEAVMPNVLLRYLSLLLAGEPSAQQYLMRAQDGIALSGYEAVVPLRFAPVFASEQFDECAGLVRRTAANVAVIDAVLAATVPAGRGKKMIERMEIIRT